jgi:DUF1680 family protein
MDIDHLKRRVDNDIFSRRDILQMAGVTAASVAALRLPLTVWARSERASATLPEHGVPAHPFPLSQVSLLAGPFQDNMKRTINYLSFVDPDRLLYTFRANVGLPTNGAPPCGGWEAPSCELRGHSMGHLLSALAQAYANTKNTTYQKKGNYLVGELAKCQAASPKAGFHEGYLSAYPESFFDRLESGQPVWAPYYTLHKILAGLLDMYTLAGNKQALSIAKGMGDWATLRTGRLSTSQMQNCLQTEFGGMNEGLVNLAEMTGNRTYLTTAQRFDHQIVYDPLAQNVDHLAGLHGNTTLAKMMGCIREYELTGSQRYADIVTNFWDMVVHHHSYAIGGNTNYEHFDIPDQISTQLSNKTCECCNTYNLLKITRQLFFHNPGQAVYMDWYEKALWNQILGQQDPSSDHGFVAYSIPLMGIRTYSNDYNDFTCDHGTGMESNTKYADSIYFYSGRSTLYVNLFIASQLHWVQNGMTITQHTTFPETNTSRLTITGSGNMTLKIRVPSWTNNQMQIRVNGKLQHVAVKPNTYATISRHWANGDVVELTLPMKLHLEPTPDNPNVQAAKYGPIVLSGAYESTAVTTMPHLVPSSIQRDPSAPLQYQATADGKTITLIPFYKNHQNYAVYWNTGSS